MKQVRVLLASKIVGFLPKEDDTDLESITDKTVRAHASMIAAVNEENAKGILICGAIRENLVKGIRKALPTISIEDRFRMALAAGAVRL
jgi:hypothetical protein